MKKTMDGKPDGSGNGRIHGSVRQKLRGRHRECRQQRARRDHGSGSGASGETQAADAGEPVDGGVLTISLCLIA